MGSTRVAASLAAFVLLAAGTAFAAAVGDGFYGIEITNGTADLYDARGAASGSISSYAHSELGVGLQYWRMMAGDYAFHLTLGSGWFRETDTPGDHAAPGARASRYTQTSWSGSVGGDRTVKIGERAAVYFGPGFEYWTGKARWDGGAGSVESQLVTRYALVGRVGGVMLLSGRTGINCEVGRYAGYATVTDQGARASWFPSGVQASAGLVFRGR